MIEDIFWLVVVGALWGCTTPLLKRGSKGIREKEERERGVLKDVLFLVSRWKYCLPFIVNQLGSAVFYWRLNSSDVSLVGPVANGLSFVFAALSGIFLFNEQPLSKHSIIGAFLILIGISLCAFSKQTQ